jgi:hypothetical protein
VIKFRHTLMGYALRITSDQLPGWFCSAPSRAMALSQMPGSLRSYLSRTRNLDEATKQELRQLLGIAVPPPYSSPARAAGVNERITA